MSSQEISRKFSLYSKLVIQKLLEFTKNTPDLIREFKTAIIIIVAWIFVSENAGYHVIDLFRSIFRIIIYPFNWFWYKTHFDETGIPEVFIVLMPVVVLVTVGFLIIISTED
ncbi:MAG: hypothetical protein ACXADY_00130 [Candidatus Hodarchaeales archaeon]|jgi:hypothetical protein